MRPEFIPVQLAKTRPWEYLVRFAFGGATAVGTGLIGLAWGPLIAGLFLAFPAILPASLTLVKQHDGRAQAADDARGAQLGSVGLGGFALVVALGAAHLTSTTVLVIASLTWLATNAGLWWARYARE